MIDRRHNKDRVSFLRFKKDSENIHSWIGWNGFRAGDWEGVDLHEPRVMTPNIPYTDGYGRNVYLPGRVHTGVKELRPRAFHAFHQQERKSSNLEYLKLLSDYKNLSRCVNHRGMRSESFLLGFTMGKWRRRGTILNNWGECITRCNVATRSCRKIERCSLRLTSKGKSFRLRMMKKVNLNQRCALEMKYSTDRIIKRLEYRASMSSTSSMDTLRELYNKLKAEKNSLSTQLFEMEQKHQDALDLNQKYHHVSIDRRVERCPKLKSDH